MQHDSEQAALPADARQESPVFETPPIEAYLDDAAALPDEQAPSAAEDDFEAAENRRRQTREDLFGRLNAAQREAVFAGPSSCLVLAAAGSGKTSVLTARIARLVTAGTGSGGTLAPESVLAVTFTNKAAQEMRNRLLGLLDRKTVNKIWVGTFHSLCARILRDNAERAGLPKTFAILDVDGQEAMCRGILKDMGLTKGAAREARRQRDAARQGGLDLGDNPQAPKPASAGLAVRLLEAGAIIDESSDEEEGTDLVTPAQCARYIGSQKEAQRPPHSPHEPVSRRSTQIDQFEAVYAEYQARCRRGGLLDFADLLSRCVALLESDAEVRDKIQLLLRAILVDEFQDTNDLQYRWLGLIKARHAHVMAVGDDDQSIYAFRGAKPENMQRFLRDFAATKDHPEGLLIRLEHNYRSLPHILEAANAVIANNDNRLGKVLRTTRPGSGERIALLRHPNGPHEAATVASAIHGLVREQGVPPSEIAVLYRANQQSRLLEAELNKRGIPLTVYGGFRFYERQEIKYAMAYLDLVCDATHDISFAKVANFPPRGLGETTIEELRQDAQARRVSMMEMVALRQQWRRESAPSSGGAALRRQVALEQFVETIVQLSESAAEMELHDLLEQVIASSGLGAHYAQLSRDEGDEGSGRMANLAELVSAARQFVADNPQIAELDTLGQLGEYLCHVALMTSTSESDMSTKNTVSLMTVHSAKGLEFDHVFVTGLEEGSFPHSRATQEDAEDAALQGRVDDGNGASIQEERRLLYVALTRARRHLQLSYCDERMLNGQIRGMDPSRFIAELPADKLHMTDLTPPKRPPPASAAGTPGRPAPQPPGWQRPPATAGRSAPNTAWPPSRAQAASPGVAWPPARPAAAAPSKPSTHGAPTPAQALGHGGTAGSTTVPAAEQANAPELSPRRVAIIGTAGRDPHFAAHMNAEMWERMLEDARSRVEAGDTLVSGGAAWSDHLAVRMFLEGRVRSLELHLPAPIGPDGRFVGPFKSSGSAANYYHDRFRSATGVDGLAEIATAIDRGAMFTTQPPSPGFSGMYARNGLVARNLGGLVAYTWGSDDMPADGGTQQTWNIAKGAHKTHVPLGELAHRAAEADRDHRASEGFRQRSA